jgi:Protein of unknown function (DUF3788)
MLTNALVGATQAPNETQVAAILGPAKKLWDDLLRRLRSDCGTDAAEWGSSSKKLGWSLRVKRKERIVVYVAPHLGYFVASFALGEKAVQAARASTLSSQVMNVIEEAKRYAEGRAVRLDVRSASDLDSVLRVAKIKIAN